MSTKNVKAAMILLGLLAAGCHTSAARQHEIHQAVDAVNRERRGAALDRVLAERGARRLDAKAEWLAWNEDLEWCSPSMRSSLKDKAPPRHDLVLSRTEGRPSLTIDCDALRDAVAGQGAFEAKMESGRTVLVVPERPGGQGEWRSLAATPGGKLLVLVPQNHVVAEREIRVPGQCNRMPSVPPLDRSGMYFVIEGRSLGDLEQVSVPFDGEEVSTRCDSYVE
jgi:hypothetical protein